MKFDIFVIYYAYAQSLLRAITQNQFRTFIENLAEFKNCHVFDIKKRFLFAHLIETCYDVTSIFNLPVILTRIYPVFLLMVFLFGVRFF